MDISKLARDKSWEFNEVQKNNHYVNHFERGLMTGSFEDGFIKGYNAAYEWKDIETFDKSNRDSILIAHILINDDQKEEYDVCEGFWDDFWNRWCTSWESIIDHPVAWMPLPKYTHKP